MISDSKLWVSSNWYIHEERELIVWDVQEGDFRSGPGLYVIMMQDLRTMKYNGHPFQSVTSFLHVWGVDVCDKNICHFEVTFESKGLHITTLQGLDTKQKNTVLFYHWHTDAYGVSRLVTLTHWGRSRTSNHQHKYAVTGWTNQWLRQ